MLLSRRFPRRNVYMAASLATLATSSHRVSNPTSNVSPSTKRKQRRQPKVKHNASSSVSTLTDSSIANPRSLPGSSNLKVSPALSTSNMETFGRSRMNLNEMVVDRKPMQANTVSGWTPINAEWAMRGPPSAGSSANPIDLDLVVSDDAALSSPLPHRPAATSRPPNPPKIRKRRQFGSSKKRLPPSNLSGGVPNATSAYLSACCFPVQPLRNPQNLLVVIDLNGTLLHRPSKNNAIRYVARPFACEFLQYCTETFTVVIWSSAKMANVSAMCETLVVGGLREKVIGIWGRDKFKLSPADYEEHVQCYKRLTYVWEDAVITQSHPLYHMGGRWNQTNTVLIDDSMEKARSEPYNLLEIPEYLGSEAEIGFVLPQVHDYLNYLAMHANVSASIRARPFKAFEPMPMLPIS